MLIASARERGIAAKQLRDLLLPATIVILQLAKVTDKDKLSHLDELLQLFSSDINAEEIEVKIEYANMLGEKLSLLI